MLRIEAWRKDGLRHEQRRRERHGEGQDRDGRVRHRGDEAHRRMLAGGCAEVSWNSEVACVGDFEREV
jgi:hypothetical protein